MVQCTVRTHGWSTTGTHTRWSQITKFDSLVREKPAQNHPARGTKSPKNYQARHYWWFPDGAALWFGAPWRLRAPLLFIVFVRWRFLGNFSVISGNFSAIPEPEISKGTTSFVFHRENVLTLPTESFCLHTLIGIFAYKSGFRCRRSREHPDRMTKVMSIMSRETSVCPQWHLSRYEFGAERRLSSASSLLSVQCLHLVQAGSDIAINGLKNHQGITKILPGQMGRNHQARAGN